MIDLAFHQDVDDAETFRSTCDAMRIVGLGEDDIQGVFTVVSIVLHLGNIVFVAGGGGEDSAVANPKEVDVIAELMGVRVQIRPSPLLHARCTQFLTAASKQPSLGAS